VIVYRSKLRVSQPKSNIPDENTLAVRLMETKWPPFEFKHVSRDQLAFAEDYAGAELVYPPVMRGSVLFDVSSSTVQVTGSLNYFAAALLLSPVAVAFFVPLGGLTFGLLSIAFAFLCYALQAKRYAAVLSSAAAEWTHPGPPEAEANKRLQPIARENARSG
jgi:hypothetical protein